MKTFAAVLASLLFSGSLSTQELILKAFNYVKSTPLPFEFSRHSMRVRIQPDYYFPYGVWEDNVLNDKVWIDIGLTVSENRPEENWPFTTLKRTFVPAEGDFRIGLVLMGALDYSKYMLITINNAGNYIDAIEVCACLAAGPQVGAIIPKQWQISDDLKVTVYQIKPTSCAPLRFDQNISYPINARRIDRTYQIGQDGRFSLLQTITYQPRDYSLNQFASKDYNIWQGDEIPE